MSEIRCRDIFGNEYMFDEGAYSDRVGAYGIYIHEGQVLLVKDAITGNWDFPGGKIEPAETLLGGLQREFIEETGLTIGSSDIRQLISFIEYFYNLATQETCKSERHFYSVKRVNGNIRFMGNGDDVAEVRMIAISELDHYLIIDLTKRLIASAMNEQREAF